MLQGFMKLGTKTAIWLLDWLESIIIKKPVISLPAPAPVTTIDVEAVEAIAAIAPLPLELPITPEQPAPTLFNPWVEISEIPEVSEIQPSATVDQLLEPTPEATAPTLTRRELVEGLLDEAWQQGITSYTALTKYVKDQSGTACSKKVISAWKKARQLNQSEAAAA